MKIGDRVELTDKRGYCGISPKDKGTIVEIYPASIYNEKFYVKVFWKKLDRVLGVFIKRIKKVEEHVEYRVYRRKE